MIGQLNDWQKQIIIGSILGGSSLVKQPKGINYYLSMRSKNDLWLKYKMEELKGCFKNKDLKQDRSTYRCNSICSEAFTELYGLLYKDGKRNIKFDIMDMLKDIGFAVWFLEGGSLTGRNKKNAYFNTTKYGKEGTEIIREYFNDILQIYCNINWNKKRMRVVCTVDGTEKLLGIISHRFPEYMIKEDEEILP